MTQSELVDTSIQSVLHHLDMNSLYRKKIFITGGTGFFGSWLLSTIAQLNTRELGIQITVLSRNPDQFLTNNPRWKNVSWLQFVQGDVKTFQYVDEKFDLLIHAATDTSRASHADTLGIFNDITIGSQHVLDFAVRAEVKRILLVSSGAVYGPQPATLSMIPDDALIACPTDSSNSAYGEGKRVMEFLGNAYQVRYGVDVVTTRCFAFVGPGLPIDQHFAIGNFIRDALFNEKIIVKGDGSAIQSYLYGADLAVWLLKILVAGQSGTSYNVGSDQYLSVKELAHRVAAILSPGKKITIERSDEVKQDLRSLYVPAIDRARQQLSLGIWTSLDNAIALTGAYYKNI